MHKLMLLFMLLSIQQAYAAQRSRKSARPEATLDSTVSVGKRPGSDSVLQQLVQIGDRNHLPLGIGIGFDKNSSICRNDWGIPEGAITLGQLTSVLNRELPGFHVELQNGVLNVIPLSVSPGMTEMLDLKLPEFRSNPETQSMLAISLWLFVRAVIAPQEGTGYVGASSTSEQLVGGMSLKDTTVRQVLNQIVAQADGALWIFRDPNVGRVSPDLQRPYDIYVYTETVFSFNSQKYCSRPSF